MIHEIHLTHSLLVREQHYTPGRATERERDLEEKKDYLMEFFVSVLLNGWPCLAQLKWGLSFGPWWGYLFPLYPRASPGSVGCYPLGRTGWMIRCCVAPSKSNTTKEPFKVKQITLGRCVLPHLAPTLRSTVMFVDCINSWAAQKVRNNIGR